MHLKLDDSYASSQYTTPFSTFTPDFKKRIDYIFTDKTLTVHSVLDGLGYNWCSANGLKAWPAATIPSDHIPMFIKFQVPE